MPPNKLHSDQITRALAGGFLIYIMQAIVVLSFAALIFSGELAGMVSYGIGFMMMGDAVIVLIVALTSSYPGSIAIEQDAPAAIVAAAVAALLSILSHGASEETMFATAVVMIVGITILTGIFFLLLGIFKLGGLTRYLPYPVIGGFLAGTGWLLLIGGISVMSEASPGMALFTSQELIHWVPGLGIGIILFIALNRFKNPLVMPALIAAFIFLFYGTVWLMKIPLSGLNAGGWLLGPFPTGGLWKFPLNPQILSQVEWSVLPRQLGTAGLVMFVSVVSLLLNANSIELVARKDIDLNRELKSAGLGNLICGLVGGIVGYQAISLSSLNFKTTQGNRLSGVLVSLALLVTVFVGATLFSFLPKMLLGGLLIFLGLSMLADWLYRAWFNFSRLDFLIIVLIVLVIAFYGYLPGIAVGLVATIVLFIVGYSQINIIKHALPGTMYRSRVIRDRQLQKRLDELRNDIYILQLQGFIFFGTAYNLFEQLKGRVMNQTLPKLRFVVIDCQQVSGLDSTGLLSFSRMQQLTEEKNIILVLTGMCNKIQRQFAVGGIFEQPPMLRFFCDLDHGIEWCENELIQTLNAEETHPKNIQEYLLEICPDAAGLEQLLHYFKRIEVGKGEKIIRQGDESDQIFLIESGQLTVWLENEGREPIRLETIQGGRIIGELGVYLNTPRNASIVADQNCVLFSLAKVDLVEIEKTNPLAASLFHHIIANILSERIVQITRALDAFQR